MLELDLGDIDYGDDDGEQGDVRRHGRHHKHHGRVKTTVKTLARSSSQLARDHAPTRSHLAHQSKSDPQVQQIAKLKHALRRPEILYIAMKGAQLVSSSLGPHAIMRDAELDAFRTAVFDAAPFQQQVFAFTSGVLNVAQVLSSSATPAGPLANSTLFRYAGSVLILSASVLNATPGAPVSATIVLSATISLTFLFIIQEGMKSVEITVLNSTLINGAPRFYAPTVTVLNTSSAGITYTLTGLPTDYTPTLQFLQPGDERVERLLALMDR